MIEIVIPKKELFDESKSEFVTIPETVLSLEHSLLSLSKWESKWHKPFLGREKTIDEIKDYVRCMTIPIKKIDDRVYDYIPPKEFERIISYIKDPMTATWISENALPNKGKPSNEAVTSEIIYYWMITFGIPFECQKWHLERLLTLIKVVNIKNQPKRKMSKKEAAIERRRLNEARRAKYNTRG